MANGALNIVVANSKLTPWVCQFRLSLGVAPFKFQLPRQILLSSFWTAAKVAGNLHRYQVSGVLPKALVNRISRLICKTVN